MKLWHIIAVIVIIGAGAWGMSQQPKETHGIVIASDHADFKIIKIADGLVHPWSLAFLPDGNMLVTERAGRLRLIQDGTLVAKPICCLPKDLVAGGQGGLLDIALHPDFAENRLVYFTYAALDGELSGTQLARAKLTEDYQLKDVKTIFSAKPKTGSSNHFGSRILFLPDGTLLITLGEKYHKMEEAQNPSNHLGSIVRLNDDGSIPEDNPFVNQENHAPEIFSYGHRNPQGLTINPETGDIWEHEHGPKGGDELNLLQAGKNYGWPAITYGVDYTGLSISDKTHMEDMEQPVIHWTPSIAPSGMTYYDGDAFPQWKGNLFAGALAHRHLRRIELDEHRVVQQEVLLEDLKHRIRDVRQGPDGLLYLLTDDGDGEVLRLEPMVNAP